MLIVVGTSMWVAQFNERNEPVPVEQGDVVVVVGRGVPAQEVVMVGAELARGIVVADVVIIGLGKRYVDHTENQKADSQGSRATPIRLPPRCHDTASFTLVERVS